MINSIRMSGLASGLDTESIVKNLMKAESSKLNKLLQKKQTEEWKRDQYREMNSLLLDLRNKTFDMRLQSSYQKKILSSDNDSIATGVQKGIPNASTYDVNVTLLPKDAKAASVKFTPISTLKDATTAIGEGEAFDFKIGSTEIKITETDSISSIIAKVNEVSGTTGVVANYLKDDNSITFTTKASGENAEITISSSNLKADNKLGWSTGTVKDTVTGFLSSTGTQASKKATAGNAVINGIPYAINSTSFTFDGVEFNIKKEGATKISLKTNEEAVFKSIKEYVDKYNEIMGKINTKISESSYRDYKPLLKEEKEALSDKQIEQWEEKAKSGLLKQDPILSNILSQMRSSLSSVVSGTGVNEKFDSLSEIGITTGLYTDKGKLFIDETKLRAAISQNGNDVMELFTKKSTSTDPEVKYRESGLAQRVYDQISNVMSKLTDKAGSSASLTDDSILGKGLKRIDKDISSWESRLADIEKRYWAKFTAMEKAMSKANSQGNWLAQSFSK